MYLKGKIEKKIQQFRSKKKKEEAEEDIISNVEEKESTCTQSCQEIYEEKEKEINPKSDTSSELNNESNQSVQKEPDTKNFYQSNKETNQKRKEKVSLETYNMEKELHKKSTTTVRSSSTYIKRCTFENKIGQDSFSDGEEIKRSRKKKSTSFWRIYKVKDKSSKKKMIEESKRKRKEVKNKNEEEEEEEEKKENYTLDQLNQENKYDHNVIYHELYVELLHENRKMENEIEILKAIITRQNEIIKNKKHNVNGSENERTYKYKKNLKTQYEERDHSMYMMDQGKSRNKSSGNNKYFFNIFGKKKKGVAKSYNMSGRTIDKREEGLVGFSDNENDNSNDTSDEHEELKIEYRQLGTSENEFSSSSECVLFNGTMQSEDETEETNSNYMIMSNIETNATSASKGNEENEIIIQDEQANKELIKKQKLNYLIYWYNEIIPNIENDEKNKRKDIIHFIITNYMPIEIRMDFWKITINNNLNLSKKELEILKEKINGTSMYVYNSNEQYRKYVLRNFKSLENLRGNSSECFKQKQIEKEKEKETITNIQLEQEKGEEQVEPGMQETQKGEQVEEAQKEIGKEDKEEKKIEREYKEKEKQKKAMQDVEKEIERENIEEEIQKEENKNELKQNENKFPEDNQQKQFKQVIMEGIEGESTNINKNNEENTDDNAICKFNDFPVHKFFYQILIDLDRTIYIIKMNQDYIKKYKIVTNEFLNNLDIVDIKTKLNTLLQMYVLFKPEVGYIQGMSYIALVFLMYCNLDTAFIHFANFMDRKDIYNLYSFNSEEIEIWTYTIKEIMIKKNIEIFKKINKHYNIDNLFIQWIFTIFLICLPFHIFIRLFDIFTFYDKIIYDIIICIFIYLDRYYHFESVDAVVKNLSVFAFNAHINERKFWNLFKTINIKKKKIRYYRRKYYHQMKNSKKKEQCE